MKTTILAIASLVGIALAGFPAQTNHPGPQSGAFPGPAFQWLTNLSLTPEARAAVVAEATRALHRSLQTPPQQRPNNEIPKALWGEAITRLKPLRVTNDRINIMIVLHENKDFEEGLYVSNPVSSYAPGLDKRFASFELLSKPDDKSFGSLYRYRMEKK